MAGSLLSMQAIPQEQSRPAPQASQRAQEGGSSTWGPSLSLTGRHSTCKPMYRTVGEYGLPWCECTVPKPGWLHQEHPEPWRQVSKALLIGPPDSAPPWQG